MRGGSPRGEAAPGRRDVSEMLAAVTRKVEEEHLDDDQAAFLAEAIAAAPGKRAKRKLIAMPYCSAVHDPEMIRERAKRYGPWDPMYRERSRTDTAWKKAPGVAEMLRQIKQVNEWAQGWSDAIEAGKPSPEARPFIRRRLARLAGRLKRLSEILQERS